MDRHFPTREAKRLSPQAHLMDPQAIWRAGVTVSKSVTPPQPRPTEPPLPLYCGGDNISVGLPIWAQFIKSLWPIQSPLSAFPPESPPQFLWAALWPRSKRGDRQERRSVYAHIAGILVSTPLSLKEHTSSSCISSSLSRVRR